MADKASVHLLEIFLVFLRIGAFSFGGGLAGWVYREVVQRRPRLSERIAAGSVLCRNRLSAALRERLGDPLGQRGRDGVAAAAVGLLILTTWRTGIQSGRSIPGAITVIATFVAVGILHLPPSPSVLSIAPLSIAAGWKRGSQDAG